MKRDYNSNYEEYLTLEEIREMYSLEYDEDVEKFVRKINLSIYSWNDYIYIMEKSFLYK